MTMYFFSFFFFDFLAIFFFFGGKLGGFFLEGNWGEGGFRGGIKEIDL